MHPFTPDQYPRPIQTVTVTKLITTTEIYPVTLTISGQPVVSTATQTLTGMMSMVSGVPTLVPINQGHGRVARVGTEGVGMMLVMLCAGFFLA